MTDSSEPTEPARSRPSSRRRRRLLALLLICLIALLALRPDLRGLAAVTAERAFQFVVYAQIGLSPRTLYTWRLRVAGLSDRPLGRRWRDAVTRAQPSAITFQHTERSEVVFAADEVDARVFRTTLRRGEALRWRLARRDDGNGWLYASIERRATASDRWRTVATLAADGHAHELTADTDGIYRIVLQPELFAAVDAHLAVSVGGSLPFPVVGGHPYDIGGGFGAPRDGGRRRHKGVDIFARRDTPVRAVLSGSVRTGTSGIGGRHIWLSPGFAGLVGPNYYYAHLDHFAVASGDHVDKGQVIGYVGNTGNARRGPTHLHFGVYTATGAIDPAPFIKPIVPLPAARATALR